MALWHILLSIQISGILSNFCDFKSIYPRSYIAYYSSTPPTLDGNLNEKFWEEVEYTEAFADISTNIKPKYETRAKVRYNDEYIFIGAMIEEPNIWANITETCHCYNPLQDQVIYHDNDFEVFIDADGSNHYYKELEVNAAAASWILRLNKPYDDGGFENSTREFGENGYDMMPELKVNTFVTGVLNVPGGHKYWSVEIAIPINKVLLNTKGSLPSHGEFWRINFSRVEWNVDVINGKYIKNPKCHSCPQPGSPNEDNWVWSAQSKVAMHLPEKWGMLQFSTDLVGTTLPKYNKEWTIRSVAMSLYYAQHAYYSQKGHFTVNIFDLEKYADPHMLDGTCTFIPIITLDKNATKFTALIISHNKQLSATIKDDRYLEVKNISELI